jgi:hypothetical protein
MTESHGPRTWLITGASPTAVLAVARQVGALEDSGGGAGQILALVTDMTQRRQVEPSLTATPFLAKHLRVAVRELPAPAYNDPAAAANTVLTAAALEDSPLRPGTGKQSMAKMRAALDARLAQLERWARLNSSADALVLVS